MKMMTVSDDGEPMRWLFQPVILIGFSVFLPRSPPYKSIDGSILLNPPVGVKTKVLNDVETRTAE
jgi:hypothetical protein